MSDETRGPVSMSKGSTDPGDKPEATPPPRPRRILYLVWALISTGVFSVLSGLSTFAAHAWVLSSLEKTNAKAKGAAHKTHAELLHNVGSTQITYTLMGIIVFLAVSFLASGAWRGRHWARWAVIGIWVLTTFTGQFASPTSLLAVAASGTPLLLRTTTFLAAASFLVAVVLVNFRDVVTFLNFSKPPRRTASPAIPRTGRFGAMAPPANDNATASKATLSAQEALNQKPATTRPASSSDRMRAKQRAVADTPVRGAEQPGVRTKTGKTRRSGS